jgi:hypothetical protein
MARACLPEGRHVVLRGGFVYGGSAPIAGAATAALLAWQAGTDGLAE